MLSCLNVMGGDYMWVDDTGKKTNHLWESGISQVENFSYLCFSFKFKEINEFQTNSVLFKIQKQNESNKFDPIDLINYLISRDIRFKFRYIYCKDIDIRRNVVGFKVIMKLRKQLFFNKLKSSFYSLLGSIQFKK